MSITLLINNADAVPAEDTTVTDPTGVTTARVAAFDADDYAGGTLDLDSAFSGDRVQFVQGAAENEEIITSIINVDDVVSVDELDYVAPVAQVTTVTAETGTGFATIGVVRADGNPRPHERLTAEVELDSKTASAIATDFADQLNEQFPDFVTVTTSGADIIITGAINYEDASGQNGLVSFETFTDGEASGWTIASTTDPKAGSGADWQVSNLEEIAWGGDYNNRIYLPITPPSYVTDGEDYKLINIKVKTNTTPNIAKSNTEQQIIIALYDGNATDNIDLATFFGV